MRMGPIFTAIAALLSAAVCASAAAGAVGWRSMTVAGAAERGPIQVALWYPTEAAAPTRAVPMGPFEVRASVGAPLAARLRGLILISHGTGGTELGHGRLAEALAARGYAVAALRHPGDNWQDQSLLTRTPERYFDERPRQASRVLDALLADEDLRRRVASDAHGPRIGAVGHSAGGYTVLALAGGKHSPDRLNRHCREHGGDDPIFCGVGRRTEAASAPRDEPGAAPIADARIRAVVALSPVGAVFDAVSLRRVDVPIAVWSADLDRFLVPRFHAEWIAQNLPATSLRRVPNAWHFAFMDTPSFNIPSPDGDIAADPDGFDRARFLDQLGPALATFFDESFAARSGRR